MHRPVRALLVTDQTTLADSIELAFARRSFLTRRAANREETWAALNHWQPHLAVIDVDGTQPELLERLGAPGIGIDRPSIIAITHQRNVETRLAAFAQGVDDILTVPFEPEELSARGAAILRRTHPEAVTFVPALCVGELEIDLVDRRVRVQGQDSQLTWLEQRLLYLLAANAGRVLTRDEILHEIWGADYVPESNVVDRHIRNLRIRLHDSWRQPRFIATVSGQGYRFVLSVVGLALPVPGGDDLAWAVSSVLDRLPSLSF